MKREDFTQEAWITLRAALHAAFLEVAVADRMLTDAEGEVWNCLAENATAFECALLQREVDPVEDTLVLDLAANEEWETLVRQAHAILRTQTDPDYPATFNQVILDLVHRVAEADGDVALKESAFMDDLTALLDELA